MAQDSTQQQKPEVRFTRDYAVAPEKVWQAWTDAQALSHWFAGGDASAMTCTELDVREGGRYHIGFRTPDGEQHDVMGVYQEVLPSRKLSFTWTWKSTPERASLVTLELRATQQGTQMSFVHTNFFDEGVRDAHQAGWTSCIGRLDAFVATLTAAEQN